MIVVGVFVFAVVVLLCFYFSWNVVIYFWVFFVITKIHLFTHFVCLFAFCLFVVVVLQMIHVFPCDFFHM